VQDPATWISRASVFVLASRVDPFPLVVLEAMALARPIVATDLPGTREQLDGSATFAEPGDSSSLGAAVAAVLSDPDAAAARGAAAARRCEQLWDLRTFAAGASSIASAAVRS
jgi:glycosyltransferase involved in cell wall biosynthesis